MSEKKTMLLDEPEVTRKVPMTKRGNDLLREFRKILEKEYKEKTGVDVNIPFPTVFHLVLEKLAHHEGVKVGRK